MSPALAVYDETPSCNLKVTNNPLKARLLFTWSTFHVLWSQLAAPTRTEAQLAGQAGSPALSTSWDTPKTHQDHQ